VQDKNITRLPEGLSIAYQERKRQEAAHKKMTDSTEAEKRKWVYGLVLFANRGKVGIMDASKNIFFPADATYLDFGRYDIDPDDNTIHVKIVSDYYGNEHNLTFKQNVPVTEFISEYDDIKKIAIKAELNPYNSLTGDYKSYFDVDIYQGFDYKKGFSLSLGNCPLCEGDGKLYDGYTLSSETFTYDRVVKDGTTTITRKNYLANERVDRNGNRYIPTTTQTYDNYKTVKEKKVIRTKTSKYKTCTLCNGDKKYRSAIIQWDDKRNEYVLTTLKFFSN
jgi:hypothetical protein